MRTRRGLYRRAGKRLLDLALSVPLALALAPLALALALLGLALQGRPVLFRQRRPGLGGRPFRIWKLRTMSEARGAGGALLPDAERLTRWGSWLRRTSLDELPELWNVIRGEMSLVGPRPLLTEYLDRYSARQRRRHEVRPGITGWAQIHGRNDLGWRERLELDVWYVDHLSLGVDAAILARTLVTVLKGRGVAAAGHATMPEFRGAPDD